MLTILLMTSTASVSVAGAGGMVAQPEGVLLTYGPSVDVAKEWDIARIGGRLTFVATHSSQGARWPPLVSGELVAFAHARVFDNGTSSLWLGLTCGVAASEFCNGDVCNAFAQRGGVEAELAHRMFAGVSLIARGHGGATLGVANGWLTHLGLGVRF